jgi:hypothetical protein
MTAVTEENPFAGQGAVLLDIGGDIGALVVTMPPETLGIEIEIRPVGVADTGHVHGQDRLHHDHSHGHGHDHGGEHLLHVAVVNRPTPEGDLPSLVFPELVTGSYELFEKGHGDRVVLTAQVTGGEVTSAEWPA